VSDSDPGLPLSYIYYPNYPHLTSLGRSLYYLPPSPTVAECLTARSVLTSFDFFRMNRVFRSARNRIELLRERSESARNVMSRMYVSSPDIGALIAELVSLDFSSFIDSFL
jgi:hypothetical protein